MATCILSYAANSEPLSGVMVYTGCPWSQLSITALTASDVFTHARAQSRYRLILSTSMTRRTLPPFYYRISFPISDTPSLISELLAFRQGMDHLEFPTSFYILFSMSLFPSVPQFRVVRRSVPGSSKRGA